jgi:chemotaxis protein MotA
MVAALAAGAAVWPHFLNIPSLLITVGGSVAVLCFSYSKAQLRELINAIWTMFTDRTQELADYSEELNRLALIHQSEGLKGIERHEGRLQDPFLRWGVAMLVDLQRSEKIYASLSRESATVLARQETSRQILLTLGKILPAFGLIGTLIGMVLLLKDIGAPDAPSLPSALSLAVLTTLYGAVLANAVVAPLAARLHAAAVEKETRMQLTLEWLATVLRREAVPVINARTRGRISTLRGFAEYARKRTVKTVGA